MTLPDKPLKGRVAIITGAAGGLGRSLAIAFGRAGAGIVALDLDRKKLAGLTKELAGMGIESLPVPCDVSDAAMCRRSVKRGGRWKGRIDIIVNNAGITHRSAFRDTDPAVIERVMKVNFSGALLCTAAALEEIVKTKGTIVAMSSVAGFAPLIARTGYSASKHALHGFFGSLRPEVEPLGVNVLIVCPSFIETGIDFNALGGDGRPALHRQMIMGKRLKPDHVAERILTAVLKRKRFITVGRIAFLSYRVSRFFPRLYERIMERKFRGEMG